MTIMRFVAVALLAVGAAMGAEVAIPDSCNGGLCLAGMRWKKGFLEHTLSGFVGPESGSAESLYVGITYTDGQSKGGGVLKLKSVGPRTPFYFKVEAWRVKWDQSRLTVGASAILKIESVEKDGVACHFSSLGSRLAVSIINSTDKDLILDYQLLTLTAGGRNLKLNGSHGKFTDQAIPNAPSLIAAGTEQKEEFIAVGAATFEDGEWLEDWRLHLALMQEHPTLTLPLGGGRIEKVPLDVRFAGATPQASGPKAR